MNHKKIISIITPCYNHDKYITETIQSVLSQKGDFYIDYVIIDGGSVDDSTAIIKNYEELLNENCEKVEKNGLSWHVKKNPAFPYCNCLGISYRWLSEKDNGQSHAINKGISLIQGDYFAWLNSDDYYTNHNVYQTIVDYFASDPGCGMVYGRGYCVDENKKIIRDYHDNCSAMGFDRNILHYECFILQPAAFIRREVIERVGNLDESLHWCMDYDLWLRISKLYEIKFIPKWLANWRQYKGIKSLEDNYKYYEERYAVFRKHSSFLKYIFNKWFYYMLYPGHLRGHIWIKYKPYRYKMAFFYACSLLCHTILRMLAPLYRRCLTLPDLQRLAVFTPLEPLQTGVATYFTKLLNSLVQENPDLLIDIYIDDGYKPIIPEHGTVRVLNHKLFPMNSCYYHSILYQMGNNNFYHYYMATYIKKYKGVVEMHDIKIRALYVYIMELLKEAIKKRDILEAIKIFISNPELRFFVYGMIARPFINKELMLDSHFYRKMFVVRKSKKIITRDVSICKRFRLPHNKCAFIIHGIDIKRTASESEKARIRERLGIGEKQFLIVTAGIIHNSKRIDKVLQALSIVKNTIPDFLYILAGKSIWAGCGIEEIIKSNSLENHVRITGWISNDDWFDYITVADIGINLRGDSSGEHSGPLVNFIERGKVLLISDYDQYKIYPDEFAIKIGHGPDEVTTIAKKIEWLYNNPEYRKHAGEQARRYAEKVLDFDGRIIKNYLNVLNLNNAIPDEKPYPLHEVRPKPITYDQFMQVKSQRSFPKQN